MFYPEVLNEVINSFRKLPGIGEKSAERYALAILELSEENIENVQKITSGPEGEYVSGVGKINDRIVTLLDTASPGLKIYSRQLVDYHSISLGSLISHSLENEH